MSFPYDTEYRILNVGAHRKPSPMLGAPSLTLHYGLWKPKDLSLSQWHENIDRFLYFIYMTLRGGEDSGKKFVSPNLDVGKFSLYCFRNYFKLTSIGPEWIHQNPIVEKIDIKNQNVRYDVFSVRTYFKELPIAVRAQLHSEYSTITFFVDFDQDRVDKTREGESKTLVSSFQDQIEKIGAFVADRYRNNSGRIYSVVNTDLEEEFISNIRQNLFEKFQRFIIDDLINPHFLLSKDAGLIFEKDLGSIFAEFHGTIFGFRLSDGGDTLDFFKCGSNKNENGEVRKTIPMQIGRSIYTEKFAPRVIDAVWPVVRELHRSVGEKKDEERFGKPEFTASLFQDGRSIYISSLGGLNPDTSKLQNVPVTYTILVSYQTRWSLGRLIERIHNLGIHRLAALRDIALLHGAGNAIRDLQDNLNKSKIKKDKLDAEEFANSLLDIGSDIQYGMMHRIERSKYYVTSFEQGLQGLRSKRIEGFQPYEQFVRWRMFSTFDYIKRVGERYIELRREIELIMEKNRTESIKDIVGQAARTMATMDETGRQIKSLSEGLHNSVEKTNLLLHNAELFIATPLIYYFGNIVYYFMMYFSGKDSPSNAGEDLQSKVISFCVSAIAVTLALVLLRSHPKLSKRLLLKKSSKT